MLRFKLDQTPWGGRRINGVAYPGNIEELWSDAELDAVGLERAPPPPITPGDIRKGVKQEAKRRILDLSTEADFDDIILDLILRGTQSSYRAQALVIRQKARDILQMDPLPEDYMDDSYWT